MKQEKNSYEKELYEKLGMKNIIVERRIQQEGRIVEGEYRRVSELEDQVVGRDKEMGGSQNYERQMQNINIYVIGFVKVILYLGIIVMKNIENCVNQM